MLSKHAIPKPQRNSWQSAFQILTHCLGRWFWWLLHSDVNLEASDSVAERVCACLK